MNQDLIQSYQPGGAIYARLVTLYGSATANAAAAAALTGDEHNVNAALAGQKLDSSFWDQFGTQIYNDPLAAPIDQAAKITANAVTAAGNGAKTVGKAALGNWGAWLIAAGLLLAAFLYFGGVNFIRRRVSNLK